MTGFSIHRHIGLKLDRARDLENFIIDKMKKSNSIPATTDAILSAKSVRSIKPLSQKERDYLLILLGIYIRRNQEAHENKILTDPSTTGSCSCEGCGPNCEDDDEVSG